MGLRRFESAIEPLEPGSENSVIALYGRLQVEQLLLNTDPNVRREGIRYADLATETVLLLLNHLQQENNFLVLETLMLAFEKSKDDQVVAPMLALLGSEDVWLRNRAQEVLLQFPHSVMEQVRSVYAISKTDEKIFLMNLMKDLVHPRVAACVIEVLQTETEVNVVAAALEVLLEIGDATCLPVLDALMARFEGNTFISFSIESVKERVLDL